MERLALKSSLRLLFSPYQQASNARWIYSDIEIVSVIPFSSSKLEMDGAYKRHTAEFLSRGLWYVREIGFDGNGLCGFSRKISGAKRQGLVEASSVAFTSPETAAWSLVYESKDKSLVKNEQHRGEWWSLKYSCVF